MAICLMMFGVILDNAMTYSISADADRKSKTMFSVPVSNRHYLAHLGGIKRVFANVGCLATVDISCIRLYRCIHGKA